ncbi:MAG: ATP-binding protein [Treponema sp.]|jgi:predicted AAA+ superfamily ATPase|nr:ATP-binding protein [Treponema sp.]
MIERPDYIKKLLKFKDKRLIKVITGVRRCGKSTLLELFRHSLVQSGVGQDQIIAINFEELAFEELRDYKKLYVHILERLSPGKMNYVFLDEVQNVPEFQRAADSLYIKENVDLYLTGSNARMLSEEIATLLSGRYIEIRMLPLSFREYISVLGPGELPRKYNRYVTESSFPYTLELEGDPQSIGEYLGGLYSTIILKDVMNRKKIADPLMLESIIRFMFFNIGNLTSCTNIANTMKSEGRPISVHTVESYLSALTDCFILYRAGRYDVKGKQFLKSGDKYYAADLGLRYYLLGGRNANAGSSLENIVYLELLRRGGRVYVGKSGSSEIDFVVEHPGSQLGDVPFGDGVEYYQVALTVRDAAVLERELAPLAAVKDHNPKYLLTMDEDPPASYEGIRRLNALDWLLQDRRI